MYIDPFIAGVFFTLAAEMGLLVVWSLFRNHNDKED